MRIKRVFMGESKFDSIEVFWEGCKSNIYPYSWRKDITDFFDDEGKISTDSKALFLMMYPGSEIVLEIVSYLIKLKKYALTDHLAMSIERYNTFIKDQQ